MNKRQAKTLVLRYWADDVRTYPTDGGLYEYTSLDQRAKIDKARLEFADELDDRAFRLEQPR